MGSASSTESLNRPMIPTFKEFRDTCLPQEFAFPKTIMEYVIGNPSSQNAYKKMAKSCKLLFLKNAIIVVNNVNYSDFDRQWKLLGENGGRQIVERMENVQGKLWVLDGLSIYSENLTFLANFLTPKCHDINVKELDLFYQHLTYNDLSILSKKVKDCRLYFLVIKYENGEFVPLEEIIKLFSSANSISMNFCDFYDNAKRVSYGQLIDAIKTVKSVKFDCLPNEFDVAEFYQNLKKTKSMTLIRLHYFFQNHAIAGVVDAILGTRDFEFVPPVIFFSEFDIEKRDEMEEIQKIIAEKLC